MQTTYAKQPFDGYKYRFRLVFETTGKFFRNIDIYSDSDSYQELEDFIEDRKSDKVIAFKIESRSSKNDDKITSELLDELFAERKSEIALSEEQLKKLNKLWFIYGNKGKKHTHYNHRYIQNLLEKNENDEEHYANIDYTKHIERGINLSKVILTEECIQEVNEILNNK